jgi:uncharacterized protein YbaR (Trm112 family)
VNLDPALLEILACPACKSPLRQDDPAGELVCTNAECALAYPVRDDIPVLLVEEARQPQGPGVEERTGAAAGDLGERPDARQDHRYGEEGGAASDRAPERPDAGE